MAQQTTEQPSPGLRSGRPPNLWPEDPAAPLTPSRRNNSCSSCASLAASHARSAHALSAPAQRHKRAKTPPAQSPATLLPESIRPHKHATDRIDLHFGTERRRSGPVDLEAATPAAGIILIRERPAFSELDDAAWGETELEVLIGRYEVVNALRSRRDRLVALRYPGEWHFPGGAKRQADRGPLQTACREMWEEFLGGSGDSAPELAATLFTKVSLSLAGRQYVQYVFVADAEDNRPLGLSAEQINHGLRRQRLAFERLVASGAWWDMARSAKAAAAPEVRLPALSLSAATVH